ncbi:MAG: hypothetical protein K6A33_06105, partial [Clostridiales bacterium]|nr:hypothetical protein [Clostridiales bacterium]
IAMTPEPNRNEKKKIGGMNEAAWVIGIVVCALGVALCTKANFGLSMTHAASFMPPIFFFRSGSGPVSWQSPSFLS